MTALTSHVDDHTTATPAGHQDPLPSSFNAPSCQPQKSTPGHLNSFILRPSASHLDLTALPPPARLEDPLPATSIHQLVTSTLQHCHLLPASSTAPSATCQERRPANPDHLNTLDTATSCLPPHSTLAHTHAPPARHLSQCAAHSTSQ